MNELIYQKPFAIFLFFLFFLFLNSFVFANEQIYRLEYSIRPLIEDGKSMLEVNLKLQGNESGVTEILLPLSWAGQDELYLEISELRCLSDEVKIQETDQPEVKKINHPSNESIQISYRVTSIPNVIQNLAFRLKRKLSRLSNRKRVHITNIDPFAIA